MNSSPSHVQQISFLLCLIVVCCSACFIRNCPLGGKRSVGGLAELAVTPQRECLRCGPSLLGQCVGPNICCGPHVGCYVNTAETHVCAKEDENPIPCGIEGEDCGPENGGKCVSDGVCCSDEECRLDSQCQRSDPYDLKSRMQANVNPEVMSYIRRLLAQKIYGRRR